MPIFNGQDTLIETLDSVHSQTFADWELIAVDDGSTDGTGDLLARCAAADPRIVPVRQENRGITRALNAGLEHVSGEYVARLDCGDLCSPNRLERQVAFLDAHPEVVAVGSYAVRVTPEGWPIDVYQPPLEHEEIDGRHIAGGAGGILHPSAMIRADAVRRIGGYCEDFRYAQDTDILLRLAEVGRLANIPESLITYCWALRSISMTKRNEQVKLSQEAVRRARERRGLSRLKEMPPAWVPPDRVAVMAKWAREALLAGNVVTALLYSWRVLLRRPSTLMGRVFLRSFVLLINSRLHVSPSERK